jgi:hypothetical protein
MAFILDILPMFKMLFFDGTFFTASLDPVLKVSFCGKQAGQAARFAGGR